MKPRAVIAVFCAIVMLATVLILYPVVAYADRIIPVYVDGERVVFEDVQPMLVEERTLVPVRGVFEHMGFNVDWDPITYTAYLTRPGDVISIRRGDIFFTVNGVRNYPPVPPQIIDSRFMLPLRAVAEATGAYVYWADPAVLITTTAIVAPPAQEPAPTFFSSAITITNRRLTDAERQTWIDEYNAGGGATAFELEVVRLTNLERANHGLAPLEICHTLMLASRFYAQTMANLDTTLGHHEGPYGGSFGTADAFGDRIVAARAANGIAGHRTPESAVQGWMDSPGHRANILNPNLTRIGTGFYLGGRWGVFGYQLFGGGAATPVPNLS